ncbi:MAG: hypothetical protein K0R03_2201 [Moraxellaceae bacterium]|jgi:hypothetical protein|nr:hypothetical protein [Moraxellaceae bacterium]
MTQFSLPSAQTTNVTLPDWMVGRITPELFDAASNEPDRPADDLLDLLKAHNIHGHDVVDGVERLAAKGEPAAVAFMEQVTTVPDWVDWELIAEGRRAWIAHMPFAAVAAINTHLLASYLSGRASHTLIATGRLRSDAWTRVVGESLTLLRDMTATDDALRPGSQGWRTLLMVRILHARVGRWASERAERPAQWGRAISVLELAFARVFFTAALFRAADNLGLGLTTREQDAINHMWRWADHLLGGHAAFATENAKQEQELYDLVLQIELGSAGDDGPALAEALLAAVSDHTRIPRTLIDCWAHMAVGPEIAGNLRIAQPAPALMAPMRLASKAVFTAADVAYRLTPFLRPARARLGTHLLTRMVSPTWGFEFKTVRARE